MFFLRSIVFRVLFQQTSKQKKIDRSRLPRLKVYQGVESGRGQGRSLDWYECDCTFVCQSVRTWTLMHHVVWIRTDWSYMVWRRPFSIFLHSTPPRPGFFLSAWLDLFVYLFFCFTFSNRASLSKKNLGVGPSKNCVYKFSPDYYTATGLSSQGRMSSSVKMSMNRHQDTPKIKEDLTPARHVYDSRNKRHLGPTASRLNKESSSLLCKRHSAPIYDTLSCKFCYIFGLGW